MAQSPTPPTIRRAPFEHPTAVAQVTKRHLGLDPSGPVLGAIFNWRVTPARLAQHDVNTLLVCGYKFGR